MSELDDVIRTAVERQDVPFAVAMVGGRDGVRWSGSAGEARPGVAAANNTIFRIYSMTKAVGSTAAMILMDRGKLDPDTPVAEILPEFAKKQVLEGFDAAGKPLMRPPRTQATVRHLATHTSGLTYEFWNAELQRYLQSTGQPSILSGLREGLDYPLMFDPGQRWEYGIGIDWLGQVVEKVDGRAIDDFCRDEIFLPLGMQDTRFEVEPDMAPRLSRIVRRLRACTAFQTRVLRHGSRALLNRSGLHALPTDVPQQGAARRPSYPERNGPCAVAGESDR
jgi:methyl acetate hydrolase